MFVSLGKLCLYWNILILYWDLGVEKGCCEIVSVIHSCYFERLGIQTGKSGLLSDYDCDNGWTEI